MPLIRINKYLSMCGVTSRRGAEALIGEKRVTINFDPRKLRLSEVAALLHRIGYTPTLRLDSVDSVEEPRSPRSLYLKLGIAGFAFGNIMLLSVCLYSGMDRFSAPVFQPLFGWISLVLALPVLISPLRHC